MYSYIGKSSHLPEFQVLGYTERIYTHSMTTFSPTLDSAITRKYGLQSLELKVQNKTALQEELGWPAEPKRPMLCLPAGVSDKLGGTLLKQILPGLLELPVEILVLGKGGASYGTYLTAIAKEHAHRMAIIPNEERAIRMMFAASDMALFLSDPADMPELENCLRYGAVPVSPKTALLSNYDPNQESGEAFLYEKLNVWHCFGAVVRALETFRFPFDWRTIQKHAMEKGV